MTIFKKGVEILNFFNDSGVDSFFENKPQVRKENILSAKSKRENFSIKGNDQSREMATSSRVRATNATNFDELCDTIKKFDGCEIKKAAINTVIYDGQVNAKIMAIGEAPGANEDEHGIPFCGQSGRLLDNIFKAIDLTRKENLLITNSVFWRPPGNRRPTAEEIEICRPFIEKMIFLLKPNLIILVGSTAVESLLNIKGVSMNTLRNKNYLYSNCYLDNEQIKTSVIFHPSYLLRQPAQKKSMWFDMLKIKKIINEFS